MRAHLHHPAIGVVAAPAFVTAPTIAVVIAVANNDTILITIAIALADDHLGRSRKGSEHHRTKNNA